MVLTVCTSGVVGWRKIKLHGCHKMMVMPPLAIAGELRMSHAGKCVWVHNSRLGAYLCC